jgi:hypothetical protein
MTMIELDEEKPKREKEIGSDTNTEIERGHEKEGFPRRDPARKMPPPGVPEIGRPQTSPGDSPMK